MRALLVVALAACSSKSAAPTPASGSAAPMKPPLPRSTMKPSSPLDVPDAGITKLRVLPVVATGRVDALQPVKGAFEIDWTSDKAYDAAAVCRIEAYNLAFFGPRDIPDAKPHEHEARWDAAPFVLDPHVCEVRFADQGKLVARACYTDGALVAGACPAGTFTPPKLPDKMTIDMQGASLALTDTGAVQVKAMFTVGQPLPDTKTDFAIVCDHVHGKALAGEGSVPLSRLQAGETLFTWQLAFFMDKKLTALPKQCEVTVTNKTTLGTFCLHEGSTDSGRCDS